MIFKLKTDNCSETDIKLVTWTLIHVHILLIDRTTQILEIFFVIRINQFSFADGNRINFIL